MVILCLTGGSSPSGEFRFVAISDCAHLCELYRSRGCDAFHYNGANLNGEHNAAIYQAHLVIVILVAHKSLHQQSAYYIMSPY